ncbi:IS3 family transposase [Mycoplasmopsis felis]|uniref:IS3 family transposase n=1 Tax=Mycoplasmopsis felis TaxID=33923 RepID=UPI00068AC16F|nr:IS3 family transposase [Mycoplasmopsis felis]
MKKEKVIVNKVIKHKKVICKSFYDNKGRYGRRKLVYYINKEYNITINPRTLGNYMKQLNLFTFVRRKKRRREEKIQILIFKT